VGELRVSWDDCWQIMAEIMGRRSQCDRRKVGAIIVDVNNKIQSSGYNGPPAGAKYQDGCLNWCARAQTIEANGMSGQVDGDVDVLFSYRTCPSLHAEANALLAADHSKIQHGTIYVSSAVCADCAKLIANSGLQDVEMIVLAGDTHRQPEIVAKYLKSMGLTVRLHYPHLGTTKIYHEGLLDREITIGDNDDAVEL
jgi:dCMP deaminase